AGWALLSPALGRAERMVRERSTRVSLTAFARSPVLVAPAVVVLFAFLVDGSMGVWSVIYLRDTLGATVLGAAIAFAAFALAMTFGRAFAARILFDLGPRRTILVSGVGSLVAGVAATVAGTPVVAAVGFLVLGFFIASGAPAGVGLVVRADEQPAGAVGAIAAG